MSVSRRSFLIAGSTAIGVVGSLGSVVAAAMPRPHFVGKDGCPTHGYGKLIKDPRGLLDLPEGFHYRMFSPENAPMSDGNRVPANHDGMAAFPAHGGGTVLIRNHENDLDDILEDGLTPVAHVAGRVYDPEVLAGGTTSLLVGRDRRLISHKVSLAGTLDNCAGGPSPWGSWLSCEESSDTVSRPHGYVFEVDPRLGGNPEPIRSMGRFDHEAVAFDRQGIAYLTEDADGPHGCFYRFTPNNPLAGRGSLHAGGWLSALAVPGLGSDLSIVQTPGMLLNTTWIDVPNPDPTDDETPVREQVIALGAVPIQKAEGTWADYDGSIWFVSSRGDGPDAEDEEDRSAAVHSGQIWRYDPYNETIELVALFPKGTAFDEPDNITVGPHGFAIACTDGDDDQWLVGITAAGRVFPFGFNALNDEEFAGATFSGDGRTLFVNVQGPPGMTFAIWGPWRKAGQ
jgi:secreted PhoX family phosphatase